MLRLMAWRGAVNQASLTSVQPKDRCPCSFYPDRHTGGESCQGMFSGPARELPPRRPSKASAIAARNAASEAQSLFWHPLPGTARVVCARMKRRRTWS